MFCNVGDYSVHVTMHGKIDVLFPKFSYMNTLHPSVSDAFSVFAKFLHDFPSTDST